MHLLEMKRSLLPACNQKLHNTLLRPEVKTKIFFHLRKKIFELSEKIVASAKTKKVNTMGTKNF